MIKQFFERMLGLDKIKQDAIKQAEENIRLAREAEEIAIEADRMRQEAEAAAVAAIQQAEEAKLSEKDRATAKGEAWVAVLDTHVNKDNIRNGFFELDWNEQFIVQLKQAGYGFDGDPEEEIVDRWFRDLARNMLADEGLSPDRGAGYINVTKLAGGKAQVE